VKQQFAADWAFYLHPRILISPDDIATLQDRPQNTLLFGGNLVGLIVLIKPKGELMISCWKS